MTKIVARNIAAGVRGLHNTEGKLINFERGQALEIELSAQELKDAKASGSFEFGGKAPKAAAAGEPGPGDPPKPQDPPENEIGGAGEGGGEGDSGPLAGSVNELSAAVADIDDVAAIDSLLEQEKAGKNRTTAIGVLEGRKAELEKPAE